MLDTHQNLFLADDDATARLGNIVAAHLAPGDIVLLRGDLGVGKTALARAIIRNLTNDATLDVPSPSFALLQPYEAKDLNILHADLYRLTDARETDELGLLDETNAIILVEWPDRDPELADKANLSISLSMGSGGGGRDAHLSSDKTKAPLFEAIKSAGLVVDASQ